jgi:hypothetical protein
LSQRDLGARALTRILAFVSLFVATLSLTQPAFSHDLAIDQLRLFRDPTRGVVRGQLTFDPELTRKLDEQLPDGEAERRVLAFVNANVRLELDAKPCSPKLEVRELWSEGGAVAGDSVMLECPAPAEARELRVSLGAPFKTLVVTVEAERGSEPAPHRSTLIRGGERTPPFLFRARALDAAWREGGPDQFAPLASADPVSGQSPATSTAQPSANARETAASRAEDATGFAPESIGATLRRFVVLGFVHILPEGLDHVLFVAGLVLGAGRRYRRLLLEISAFTLAHTLTLALGALGWVVVPGAVIEPLIAASIVLVAVENLFEGRERKHRLLVVFVFGLIHGQGFASVLSEAGLPSSTFVPALLSFNIGVELGQLVVVALVLVALHFLSDRARTRYAVRPGSIAIAAIGLFWAVSRVLG